MAVTLTRIQTASGKLSVDDRAITLERPAFPQPRIEVLPRASITSVVRQVAFPRTFGRFGGAVSFTFAGIGGERMSVKSVPWDRAVELCDLFQIPRP